MYCNSNEAQFIEGLFFLTKKRIDNEAFIEKFKSQAKDFSRDRKLEFKQLVLAIMSLGKFSVQVEIDRFFKSFNEVSGSIRSISRSAFTQSRKKLLSSAFVELADEHLRYFQSNASFQKTWKGYRPIAIDGSTINLPNSNEIRSYFGYTRNQYEEMNRAKCSFAYDVCNELIIDAQITAYKSCEKDLAVKHLSKLNPETDILIFDRGYPALWLMGLLKSKGFKFCFRLSSAWKDAVSLTKSKKDDIDWISTRRSRMDLGKLITYNIPNTLEGLRLVKIPLSSGESEVLATNLLDRETFDLQSMKSLYNLRWGIEEVYKSFKKSIHIESFTGKTIRAIEQEFYAKIFMLNIASMIRTQFIDPQKIYKQNTKYKQKVNKTQVLAKTKDFLIQLFYSKKVIKILYQMKLLLENCFDIIRPNRSFERKEASSRRRLRTMNYKGV